MNKANIDGYCTVKYNEDNATVCSFASSRKIGEPCEHLAPFAESMNEAPKMFCHSMPADNDLMLKECRSVVWPPDAR